MRSTVAWPSCFHGTKHDRLPTIPSDTADEMA